MGVAPAAAAHSFGKYSLVAKLATGGMAEIFLSRLQGAAGFEKLVCIKRILPHLAKDQQLVGMFLAEARIAAQISHPNVCQVFELGEIDGRYFIAMEYLEGVPFSCFRRRDMYSAQPDPRLVAGLGVQACEGLHHAHQLKRPDGSLLEVVHRDVSSNNLFATVDGVVKVLDFGIAKVQDASVRTSTGSVKGTYAYMAPEQLRGERVDRRTDVFAVGIVLWELFARRHLFRRDTDFLTFQAITADPIPDVAEFRPDVPPALAATIAKALSRDREARFPTARALGEALTQSVQVIGGPYSASMIADEIAQAFEARLRDQQGLIRVAREGGVLSLDDDLGPAVGHGTALVTTPVSILSSRGSAAIDPQAPEATRPGSISAVMSAQVAPGAGHAAPGAAQPSSSVSVASALHAQPPAGPRPSSAMPVAMPLGLAGAEAPVTGTGLQPLAPRSRLPVILLSILAVGGIGAAVLFYLQSREAKAPKAPPPTMVMATTTTPDAMAHAPQAPPAATPDAAVAIAAAGPDPAPALPSGDSSSAPSTSPSPSSGAMTRTERRASTRRDPTPPAKPAGPPGRITIDSSPVYATIYIDGKNYGETPLVQISLSPGKHAVRAVSPSGATRTMSITIESGKVAPTRRIEW